MYETHWGFEKNHAASPWDEHGWQRTTIFVNQLLESGSKFVALLC
jgi:hypothetical protein